MFDTKNIDLIEATAKQVQFCNGIKAIVDGGCSSISISSALDELCDSMELIDQLANLEHSNR